MTEQQTVTCRSVCERLIQYDNDHILPVEARLAFLTKDARLALGQPDSDAALRSDRDRLQRIVNDAFTALPGSKHMNLTIDGSNLLRHIEECSAEFDELRADVRSLTQQLDAKDARLEDSKRLASEWQKRAEAAEKTASNLLDNLASSSAALRDATARADGMERAGQEQARRADQNQSDMLDWRKRAEAAEATVAQQNALLAKSSTKDVTIELGKMTQRAERAELAAQWLLDRLVERGAS